jgi:hypothetical protein
MEAKRHSRRDRHRFDCRISSGVLHDAVDCPPHARLVPLLRLEVHHGDAKTLHLEA